MLALLFWSQTTPLYQVCVLPRRPPEYVPVLYTRDQGRTGTGPLCFLVRVAYPSSLCFSGCLSVRQVVFVSSLVFFFMFIYLFIYLFISVFFFLNRSQVFQLETAMGAAIECFPGAGAVAVPRTRFAPVKKCNDLLLLRSDAYVVNEHFNIVLAPERCVCVVCCICCVGCGCCDIVYRCRVRVVCACRLLSAVGRVLRVSCCFVG